MRRAKKSTRKRSKSADEQLVQAQWSDADLQQLQPVPLQLDPALRERIRSDHHDESHPMKRQVDAAYKDSPYPDASERTLTRPRRQSHRRVVEDQ